MIDTKELLNRIEEAYNKCENEIRAYINQMIDIYLDKTSTNIERKLAFNTILDGLEPYLTDEEIKLLTM